MASRYLLLRKRDLPDCCRSVTGTCLAPSECLKMRCRELTRGIILAQITLQDILEQQFNAAASGDLDVQVTFSGEDFLLHLVISEQRLKFITQPATPEMVIYGRDEALLIGLLQGSINPLEAFMAGDLRSNGYLMWVFQVLGAFPPLRGAP